MSGPGQRERIDAATALRTLQRRRLWLLPVLAMAVGVGLLVGGQRYVVNLSSTEILVDTPSSQAVDVGVQKTSPEQSPPDLETLATRARLLGSLMSAGEIKDAIAKEAGVPADELIVIPPPGAPDAPQPPGVPDPGEVSGQLTTLTLTTDPVLPILRATAQAPDAETAVRLATASARQLEGYVGNVAAAEDVPQGRRLVVDPIGGPRTASETRGPSLAVALLAALATALAGCTLVALVPARRTGGGSSTGEERATTVDAEANGAGARGTTFDVPAGA